MLRIARLVAQRSATPRVRLGAQSDHAPFQDESHLGRAPYVSPAQNLLDDILDCIFFHIDQHHRNSALRSQDLASCTLVCRSWHTPASRLLLRRAVVPAKGTRGIPWDKLALLRKTSPTPISRAMLPELRAACQASSWLFSNIRELHVSGQVGFLALRETVLELQELQSLTLNQTTFLAVSSRSPTSNHHGQPGTNFRLKAMNSLTLINAPGDHWNSPHILDVISWFSDISTLRVVDVMKCDAATILKATHPKPHIRCIDVAMNTVGYWFPTGCHALVLQGGERTEGLQGLRLHFPTMQCAMHQLEWIIPRYGMHLRELDVLIEVRKRGTRTQFCVELSNAFLMSLCRCDRS